MRKENENKRPKTLAICIARNATQTNIRSPISFQYTFLRIGTCNLDHNSALPFLVSVMAKNELTS